MAIEDVGMDVYASVPVKYDRSHLLIFLHISPPPQPHFMGTGRGQAGYKPAVKPSQLKPPP